MTQPYEPGYMKGQIHLQNGVYLTVHVNISDNFLSHLQRVIYPCRFYSDPDTVAALISREYPILAIGIKKISHGIFTDIDTGTQELIVSALRNEDQKTLFCWSFPQFLSLSLEEIDEIWDVGREFFRDDSPVSPDEEFRVDNT
ncbi:MAG: hypothetical protein JXA44_06205 [Methanospirillaceae archaeon]|nr:hypothetical protein [Methanospirillaceae archaeon]